MLLKKLGRRVDFEKPFDIPKSRGWAKKPLGWEVVRPLLKRHLMPEARSPDFFIRYATSMIDVSDGLFIDLSRLCDESGVGARIYLDKVPVSEEMRTVAAALGLDPMGPATSGGEDYELLFTASSGKAAGAVCIGEVAESARVVVDKHGSERPLMPSGFEHFKSL
jgi:thiamine-monophosphate kinase